MKTKTIKNISILLVILSIVYYLYNYSGLLSNQVTGILIIIGIISVLYLSVSYTFKEKKRSEVLYKKYKPLVDKCYDRDELDVLYDNLFSECTRTIGERSTFSVDISWVPDFKIMLNILETKMNTIDNLKKDK